MSIPNIDNILSEAYTAVFCDVLDDLGYRDQALGGNVHPLWPEARLLGTARTILVEDVEDASESPYEVEFSLVDDLVENEIVVAQCGAARAAFWGELLTTAALNRGARGAVIDGYCRDVSLVHDLEFPVFARGMAPTDSKGRCEAVSRDVEITCDGVMVRSGDLLFGDSDGVVVIPSAVADQAVKLALAKVSSEKTVFEALKGGMSAREAWDTWGVL
jgi:4-hydroxy-4-methyl-2-oxoglutarate aldolase